MQGRGHERSRRPPGFQLARAVATLPPDLDYLFRDQRGQAVTFGAPLPFTYTQPGTGGAPAGIAVAANGSTRVNVPFRADNGFIWSALVIEATAPTQLTLRIVDEESGREYMDAPILCSLMAGNSLFPYRLPVPVYVRPNQTISYTFADLSGAPQTVELGIIGFKLTAPGSVGQLEAVGSQRRTPFWHRFQLILAAGVGSITQQPITVQASGAFELSELQCNTLTAWRYQLRSGSGGHYFVNEWTDAALAFGNAATPGYLHAPAYFHPREDILIEGRNDQAGGQTVTGCLAGAKVWE